MRSCSKPRRTQRHDSRSSSDWWPLMQSKLNCWDWQQQGRGAPLPPTGHQCRQCTRSYAAHDPSLFPIIIIINNIIVWNSTDVTSALSLEVCGKKQYISSKTLKNQTDFSVSPLLVGWQKGSLAKKVLFQNNRRKEINLRKQPVNQVNLEYATERASYLSIATTTVTAPFKTSTAILSLQYSAVEQVRDILMDILSWEIAGVVSPCLPCGLWSHIVMRVFLLLGTVCLRHLLSGATLLYSWGRSSIRNMGMRVVAVVPQPSADLSLLLYLF